MSKFWKQLGWVLIFVSAHLALFLALAHAQTPSSGIDQKLMTSARAGDATAQISVAHAYSEGQSVPQDYAQAALWYRKAAEQGEHKAEFDLGLLFSEGKGVTQDDGQAAGWYRKAAEQGDRYAQRKLGSLYEDGFGVAQDYNQAVSWYHKAADQDDPEAQYKLGQMYYGGQGVQQDYTMAVFWDRRAAEQGNKLAKYLLDTMVAREANQREERDSTIKEAVLAGAGVCLALLLYYNWQMLISRGKKLIPRTLRAKQLAVLLFVASWCCVCCLYEAFDSWAMRHPINALATALLFSAPALIFGAVSLWWLTQAKNEA